MTPRQLRAAIKRLGISKSELARRLRVSPTTVFRWLSGDRGIPGPAETAIELMERLQKLERGRK